MNNLKLQKLLYFLEVRFLLETEISLFEEPIEKWRYGPVIPEVYYRFNQFGAEDINQIPQVFDFMSLLNGSDFSLESSNNLESFTEILEDEDKILIDDTVLKLIQFDPFTLVRETHKHQPWARDEHRILAGERNIEYDREEIAAEFIDKPEYSLWLQ